MIGVPGQIQIYTGEGKGKTTAALGLILRFLGSGGRACLIQFDKGAVEGQEVYFERRVFPRLEGLTHLPSGLPRFDPKAGTFRFKNIAGDFEEARRGFGLAKEALGQGYGLLVLDELLSLVLTGLLPKEEVLAYLDDFEARGRPCELLLTGHQIWPELVEKADLVTEMSKVKHYFDRGIKARKGIEY